MMFEMILPALVSVGTSSFSWIQEGWEETKGKSYGGMAECKPCSTPVDTNPKVSATDGVPVADAFDFRSLAGALQYLTFTRPDIAYAV
jgi:hypothetical protein